MGLAISINGQIPTDSRSACIPVTDRGFLYGDSIYEVLRTYQGRLFAVREHMERLERSAAAIGLKLPMSRDALVAEMKRTMQAAQNKESYVRIVITRGSGEIGLDPSLADEPRVIIIAKELFLFPSWGIGKGITARVVGVRRNYREALSPSIKSGNYLNNILAMSEARSQGADDAVMLDFKGRVTEGTTSNLFIVRDGKLLTPPMDVGILDGVTRKFLLEIAREQGLDVAEEHLWPEDLLEAQEIFFCGTLKEVLPVIRIDDHVVGDGTAGHLTRKLSQWFEARVPSHLDA